MSFVKKQQISLKDIKEFVECFVDDEVKLYTNSEFNCAFVGLTHDGRAVYDYELMIESLVNNDKMTREEAIDFIDYNTFGVDDGKQHQLL